jgi:hypothetical protein
LVVLFDSFITLLFYALGRQEGGDFIVYYQKLKIQPEAQAFMCDEFSN